MSNQLTMEPKETVSNTPKDLVNYSGKFVIFFSEDKEPQVLFSTVIADEAFNKAQEIKQKEGREPVVIRVQENISNNIAQVLMMR